MIRRAAPLAMIVVWVAAAQAPEFDAATVKLSPPPDSDRIFINLGRVTHGKVTLSNATLGDCLKFAYSLSSDAQLAGPDWMRSGPPRLDIVAQAAAGTPEDQLLPMLQRLLTERLNLRLHREERQLSFAALVVAPGGPKLQPVDSDTPLGNAVSIPGRIISPRMSMTTLAKLLARFGRQTVLDLTGLDRSYEIHLEYAPDNLRPTQPDAAGAIADAEKPSGPSLHQALQLLGLRLESRKGPVDVLVVDSAEKTPAEN